ncbi:hypothetical protein VP1G_10844 [Cytospora mali]|uniref:Uncharacterized protein n=1 Tax=Cytospora mali TaxID=578113 RepID=A0A194UWX7_CYTMA|nr:hypothetical protein VP1G_10844 [Valsa mali var. pyri (nom. inval.)]
MYSRDETVSAVLNFYQQMTRHPYLDSSALALPPPTGWTRLDLHHKPSEKLLINYETIPILVDYLGSALILDTDEGTMTEFSHAGSRLTVPFEEYEALLETEKLKAHRVLPTAEFLDR